MLKSGLLLPMWNEPGLQRAPLFGSVALDGHTITRRLGMYGRTSEMYIKKYAGVLNSVDKHK